jgi:prepilin-type N-terminal cleavage/methylation domain-containing protein
MLRRARQQAGFTLVEQLVAILILGTVVGATLTAFETMLKATPADQEWSHTVANTQAGIYKMTRELRQATTVTLVTAYVVSADVVLSGKTVHVLYQCDLETRCSRKATTAPTAAPARGCAGASEAAKEKECPPVVRFVQSFTLSKPIFTLPATKYVKVEMVVRSAGEITTKHTHNVTLVDGFYARNS